MISVATRRKKGRSASAGRPAPQDNTITDRLFGNKNALRPLSAHLEITARFLSFSSSGGTSNDAGFPPCRQKICLRHVKFRVWGGTERERERVRVRVRERESEREG
jgi:hypothetical protein